MSLLRHAAAQISSAGSGTITSATSGARAAAQLSAISAAQPAAQAAAQSAAQLAAPAATDCDQDGGGVIGCGDSYIHTPRRIVSNGDCWFRFIGPDEVQQVSLRVGEHTRQQQLAEYSKKIMKKAWEERLAHFESLSASWSTSGNRKRRTKNKEGTKKVKAQGINNSLQVSLPCHGAHQANDNEQKTRRK